MIRVLRRKGNVIFVAFPCRRSRYMSLVTTRHLDVDESDHDMARNMGIF